jgi:hypothetical protein
MFKIVRKIKNYWKMRKYIKELKKDSFKITKQDFLFSLENSFSSKNTLNLLEILSTEITELNPKDEKGALFYPHRKLATVDKVFDNKEVPKSF